MTSQNVRGIKIISVFMIGFGIIGIISTISNIGNDRLSDFGLDCNVELVDQILSILKRILYLVLGILELKLCKNSKYLNILKALSLFFLFFTFVFFAFEIFNLKDIVNATIAMMKDLVPKQAITDNTFKTSYITTLIGNVLFLILPILNFVSINKLKNNSVEE